MKKFLTRAPGFSKIWTRGPDGALTFLFLNMARTMAGMDKPRDLKFCRGVKYQQMLHMCPGVFQNSNQEPLDGAVKTVFHKYDKKF